MKSGAGRIVRRRSPKPPTADRKAKPRKPRPGTWDFEKAINAFSPVVADASEIPQSYLAAVNARREACERGDLLALNAALNWCVLRTVLPRVINKEAAPPDCLVEVPWWLMKVISVLARNAINGNLPKRRGPHSTEAARARSDAIDYRRFLQVLATRQAGFPWASTFEQAARDLSSYPGFRKDVCSPETVRRSYKRVVNRMKADPLRYYHS